MNLKQRLHDSLTEKIDTLDQSTRRILADIHAEYEKIDQRAQANAVSYRRVSELNEQYHDQARKLVATRRELLDVNHGEIEDVQLAVYSIHPEEE